MQISGLGRPSYVTGFGASPNATTVPRVSFASVDGQAWIRLADEADQLRSSAVRLRRLLERVDPNRYVGGATQTRTIVGTAATQSPTIPIDFVGSYAVRRPREAINTDPPPYGPVVGEFSGSTTGTATVSGTYTGGGPESYTFRVDRVRSTSTRFEILDANGDRVRRITVEDGQYGDAFNVQNGLQVVFQDGNWVEGDSFTIDVDVEDPLPFDPDVAFDAGAVFEAGESVSDGSFTVNGTQVDVFASDTLNDVLARIDNLTDVRGEFDAETQMVVLTRKTVGNLDLTLDNDTSGFLSATKLDRARLERGGDADPDEQMRNVDALSPVQDGTITINGVALDIRRRDTLNEVLAAINAADNGATAAIVDGTVSITSDVEGVDLVLDDGSTAFFATLGIDTGTIEAPRETITEGSRRRPAGAAGATAREIADLTMDIGRRIAAMLAIDVEGTLARAAIAGVRGETRANARSSFSIEDSTTTARLAGLSFDLADDSLELFGTDTADRRRLTEAIGADIRSFHAGMLGDEPGAEEGFLHRIEAMSERVFAQARGKIDLRL